MKHLNIMLQVKRHKHPQLGSLLNHAFTTVELLVVVVILSILSGVTIAASIREIWRNEARTAALDISQWLEAVRRNATRGAACTVTIANQTSATAATTIATSAVTTSPTVSITNQCLISTPLRLESIAVAGSGNTFRVNANPTTSFSFTSRGTIFNAAAPSTGDFTNPLQISVNTVSGGVTRAPMFCVRVRPPMGEIDVISNNSATTGRCSTP